MKTTINKVNGAVIALIGLSRIILPFATARELKRLRDALRAEAEFLAEEEGKLIEFHGGRTDGVRLEFRDRAAGAEYLKELNALLAREVDVDVTPVRIPADTEGLRLSAEDLENLEGIIEFV